MADSNSAIHTQVQVSLIPGGDPTTVSIFADTAEELLGTIAVLTGQARPQAPAAAPANPTPAPQPQPAAQPAPSQPAAPAPAVGPSATATVEPPSQPSVSKEEVLRPARELLQQPDGEAKLAEVLQANNCTSISTANPASYGALRDSIQAKLGGQ